MGREGEGKEQLTMQSKAHHVSNVVEAAFIDDVTSDRWVLRCIRTVLSASQCRWIRALNILQKPLKLKKLLKSIFIISCYYFNTFRNTHTTFPVVLVLFSMWNWLLKLTLVWWLVQTLSTLSTPHAATASWSWCHTHSHLDVGEMWRRNIDSPGPVWWLWFSR